VRTGLSNMAESETRLVGNTDEDLREWIRTNMVSERSTLLRDLRERAAKILSLNDDGSIRPRPGVQLPARELVLSAYIGRHYAVAAGLTTDPSIENKELGTTLSLPKGTIGRCLKELRDARLIQAVTEGRHILPLPNLDRALQQVERSRT